MSPVERLEAAIAKLERIKAESTPGGWEILDGGDRFIAWHDDPASTGFDYIVSEPIEFEREADAERITMLAAGEVLDAQIAILQDAVSLFRDPIPLFAGHEEQILDVQIALADAILGSVS